jgi:hypothetical protein
MYVHGVSECNGIMLLIWKQQNNLFKTATRVSECVTCGCLNSRIHILSFWMLLEGHIELMLLVHVHLLHATLRQCVSKTSVTCYYLPMTWYMVRMCVMMILDYTCCTGQPENYCRRRCCVLHHSSQLYALQVQVAGTRILTYTGLKFGHPVNIQAAADF